MLLPRAPAATALLLVLSGMGACSDPKVDGPPVLRCAVPSMVQQYGQGDPPATFSPGIPAPSCIRTRHDAIVVLGCPNDADGGPAPCQTARADLAVGAKHAGLGEAFITSGGAVHNAYVEAETLRALLVDRGVAPEQIFVEPKAEHTDENLYWSTRIMQEHGWTTAIVVSEDPRHLVMTGICDSNCCVRQGRLTVFDFDLPAPAAPAPVKLGHYELGAPEATAEECETIRRPLMCLNLPNRRACRDRLSLPP